MSAMSFNITENMAIHFIHRRRLLWPIVTKTSTAIPLHSINGRFTEEIIIMHTHLFNQDGRPSKRMSSYQYRDPQFKDKAVSRPPYLYNGKPHTWKHSLHIEMGPWFKSMTGNSIMEVHDVGHRSLKHGECMSINATKWHRALWILHPVCRYFAR